MKKCSKCDQSKPLTDFYNAKGGKDGKRGSCINCDKSYHSSYNRSKRTLTKEQINKKKEYMKKHYQDNKSDYRDYRNKRYKEDPCFRLSQIVRCRISAELRKKHKTQTKRSIDLLGCTFQELRNYLESLFQEGMSWDNYGEWHIDHIKPCSKFDLTKKEEQEICFHYSNMQPLWAKDNLVKNNNH